MKINWSVIFCSLAVIAGGFAIAFVEGANLAMRDAAPATQVAHAR